MVVIVTRDVAPRFRGFLASVMLEIGPGVYTSPRMNAGVRERVWNVLEEWYRGLGGGSIVMTWADNSIPTGQGLRVLGDAPKEFTVIDGLIVVRSTSNQVCQKKVNILSHEAGQEEGRCPNGGGQKDQG